eukprot:6178818-Pleurochrysis_carterae.AAC.4
MLDLSAVSPHQAYTSRRLRCAYKPQKRRAPHIHRLLPPAAWLLVDCTRPFTVPVASRAHEGHRRRLILRAFSHRKEPNQA